MKTYYIFLAFANKDIKASKLIKSKLFTGKEAFNRMKKYSADHAKEHEWLGDKYCSTYTKIKI
jgi:hypothetical protein